MRGPRAAIIVGVIGLVLLAAGWSIASVGTARSPAAARQTTARHAASPPASLLRQLRRWLAQQGHLAIPGTRVPPQAPLVAPHPHGSTCYVAGGFCSIRPCVVPVATSNPPPCAHAIAPTQAVIAGRP